MWKILVWSELNTITTEVFLMVFYLIKKQSMSYSQQHLWNFNLINNCNIKSYLTGVKFCFVSEERYWAYHFFKETANENKTKTILILFINDRTCQYINGESLKVIYSSFFNRLAHISYVSVKKIVPELRPGKSFRSTLDYYK